MECLDRIYLNGYVPNLQVGGQVVSFMTAHMAIRSRRRLGGEAVPDARRSEAKLTGYFDLKITSGAGSGAGVAGGCAGR